MFVSAAPTPSPPITQKHQLVTWLESGCRPPSMWGVATGVELQIFDRETLRPAPCEGEHSLSVLLDELLAFKWQPVREDGRLVGLTRDHASISLGPGGQLALLGGIQENLHATHAELAHHFDEIGSVARVLNLAALGMGFQPKWRREEMPRIPIQRYNILAAHMPETGSLGIDMMARTATCQIALDFSDERDMVAKMRVALALQPIVGVLFATSPFRDGRPSGDLSFRNRTWQHTDPVRCAYLEFVFSEGFGFESYVDWALSVPLSFVRRDGQHIDLTGSSFLDLLNGRLPQVPGTLATLPDWIDHLGTLFPPVRLDRFLEMRGADMGSHAQCLALAALWTGLLYDRTALDEATSLIRDWTAADRVKMYSDGPKLGLDAKLARRSVKSIAADMVGIAERGLIRRARCNEVNQTESAYLAPLHAILDFGLTPAEDMVRRFFDDWNGEIDPVFTHCRIV